LTREPLINRKPGSSKILINQWFTREKGKRVIKWQTCNISCNWTKTVNYSLPSNFVDFALSSVTCQVKKLEGWLGAWTSFWKSLTPGEPTKLKATDFWSQWLFYFQLILNRPANRDRFSVERRIGS
jgi:hypothetical protein